ncbi:MAG TPA: DUF3592 domain-containing protein [Terriglobales bacterium]|nr:DUF3592 domain-containing protein [Terriglobales bacterium]
MSDNLVVFAIPTVFVLVGIGLIWISLRSRKLANASKAWPSAPGRILSSCVQEYENTDTDRTNTRITYTAEVEYEYAVEGQTLRGKRVQFGLGGSGNSTAIRNIVARYPAGKEVQVYYDPAKTSQCTLEQTAAGSLTFLLVIGVAFVVFGPLVTSLIVFSK